MNDAQRWLEKNRRKIELGGSIRIPKERFPDGSVIVEDYFDLYGADCGSEDAEAQMHARERMERWKETWKWVLRKIRVLR